MIPVTLAEVEEAKCSIIRYLPQEIDYIASLYRASSEIAILRKNLAMCKDLNRDIINENPVSSEFFARWTKLDQSIDFNSTIYIIGFVELIISWRK